MLHKTSYVQRSRCKGRYATVTPASFPIDLEWKVQKAYVHVEKVQCTLNFTACYKLRAERALSKVTNSNSYWEQSGNING